jgi:hypothetical protein
MIRVPPDFARHSILEYGNVFSVHLLSAYNKISPTVYLLPDQLSHLNNINRRYSNLIAQTISLGDDDGAHGRGASRRSHMSI